MNTGKILQFIQPFPEVETTYGRIIHEAVVAGLWPFKPEFVEMGLYFDIDFNVHWLYVEARHRATDRDSKLFSKPWRFFHREKIDSDVMIFDPYKETHRLALLMRDAFRFRDAVPNIDGHNLGEE